MTNGPKPAATSPSPHAVGNEALPEPQYAGSNGLININKDDVAFTLLDGHYLPRMYSMSLETRCLTLKNPQFGAKPLGEFSRNLP